MHNSILFIMLIVSHKNRYIVEMWLAYTWFLKIVFVWEVGMHEDTSKNWQAIQLATHSIVGE